MATPVVWPSAYSYSVGTPEGTTFAAQYPARPFPYRRFGGTLASDVARLGAGVGR